MSAREEILSRLRTEVREAELPPAWESKRDFPDLVARFTETLTASLGEVRQADSLESAWEEVGAILREEGAKAVVANDEPPLSAEVLTKRWPDYEWHIVGQTTGDLREFCIRADVGISCAEAALAETGSIVVRSGPGKSRLATLLPPVHVALVPISCLTPDIFTWTAERFGEMPANLLIISGPSKTADIEFTLTLGVHGPGRLVVVLF
ncbi:lactate utilization protein C [Candidatus Poribacteria bacterium]